MASVTTVKTGQSKGDPPDAKAEQLRMDGQQVRKEMQGDGVMGIKAQIKEQVLRHIEVEGKLLLYWKRQSTTGNNYPYVFPMGLSIALQCGLDTVCEVICDMIAKREVQAFGNIPSPITAPVLVQHVERWNEINRNPAKSGGIQSKLSLLSPFAITGKTQSNLPFEVVKAKMLI